MSTDYAGASWYPAHADNFRRGRIAKVTTIVIHTTEGATAAGAASWFARGGRAPSSAHYIVDVDGSIIQSVRESDTAYAAPNANANGIHVEHTGFSNKTNFWANQAMMKASAKLVADICRRHKLPVTRVVIKGHHEIPGNTHYDPGSTWPWKQWFALVQEYADQGPAAAPETPKKGQKAPEPLPVQAALWKHKDGISVAGNVTYGLAWPAEAASVLVLADGQWVLYFGAPTATLKAHLHTLGKRVLTAIALNAAGDEIARDDLEVIAK